MAAGEYRIATKGPPRSDVSSTPVTKVVEHLRKTMLRQDEASLSDSQLLDLYLEERDDAAFAALVRRHGPMVWGVCQRIIGHTNDAEDAFQAAFLILVRKAAAIKPREAVGNWLYGVAYHASLKARTAARRVRAKEKQVTSMPEPAQDRRDEREELQKLLDQELNALPDKYRLPVVLCDLEGRPRKEVAAQLKIPEGTLSSRLATAHQMLAKRLARHGLAVSGASLTGLLAQTAASAGVPAAVISSTIQTATLVAASNGAVVGVASTKVAALTEGVMKAMLLSKLKIATAAVLLLSLIAGAGVFIGGSTQPAVSQAPNKKAPAQVAPAPKPREETLALMRMLEQPIKTNGLQEKVKLKTALEYITNKFGGKVPILIDREAFITDLGADAADPYEEEVVLPPVPATMTLDQALRLLISQIGNGRATYVIRRSWIEITTEDASRAANSLHHLCIVGTFHQRPLAEILQALSDKADVAINIDSKAEASMNMPISATFRNCSLEEALVTVTEMGALKYVVLDHSIFVTTPERAKAMEQVEVARRKKREESKLKKGE
jgi:RNA polymerase sigma factor (sigma-70 family)